MQLEPKCKSWFHFCYQWVTQPAIDDHMDDRSTPHINSVNREQVYNVNNDSQPEHNHHYEQAQELYIPTESIQPWYLA